MSFFRKPTFNGLYTPFGSPRQRGTETFLTVKEGSTSLTKPLSCPKREDVTALSADFSTSPSLLQGELHFLPKPLFNGLYTPFGSPVSGGTEGSGDVTALRCSEPLRYKVVGPSKVFAIFCGMGPSVVGEIQMGRMYQGSLRTSLLQDEDGNAKVGKVICSTI